MNLDDLKKPFKAQLISWRVGATNQKSQQRKLDKGEKVPSFNGKALPTSGIGLAYIDARDVMERLDEVCGAANWQALHPHANGKTSCKIGIRVSREHPQQRCDSEPSLFQEWVWKENGSGDSAMDAEKGAFSDSFKRAAVLWGIGRYLYDVPNIWVDLDDFGKIKNPDDPRLAKALKDAEKGIHGSSEPEPIVNPFTDDECNMLIDRIRKAPELMDLNGEKANARAAWPRMSKKHQDLISEEIKKREEFVSQIPLAAE